MVQTIFSKRRFEINWPLPINYLKALPLLSKHFSKSAGSVWNSSLSHSEELSTWQLFLWNILEIMNYTTAGTVPFSIKFKQDKKSLDRCRSSFSNQSTTSSNSSKSVSSFSSATNYSCQRSNNNNSSSKLHKSPRCFDDLNQLSKWIICIIVVNYEKYTKIANMKILQSFVQTLACIEKTSYRPAWVP